MTPAELAAKGLRVKPLVWRQAPWSMPKDEKWQGMLVSNTCYRVIGNALSGFTVFDPWLVERISEHRTAAEAKAAAEAHHAAAIAALIEGGDDA